MTDEPSVMTVDLGEFGDGRRFRACVAPSREA